MSSTPILMSALATQAQQGGKLTVDASDAVTLSTASNVSVLRNGNSSAVAKVASEFQWALTLDAPSGTKCNSVATDNSGNVYAAGWYSLSGTQVFDASGTLITTLRPGTSDTAFIFKASSTGIYQWIRTIDGSSPDYGNDIAVDTLGNCYVTGRNSGTTQIFDTSGTSIRTLPASSNESGFLLKLDSSGALQWVVRVDGAQYDEGFDVAVDGSGNVCMQGRYTGSGVQIFNNSGTSVRTLRTATNTAVFIARFTTMGTLDWIATLDGTMAFGYSAFEIATDSTGNIFASGSYNANAQVYDNSGTSIKTLRATASTASYLLRFTSSGSLSWAYTVDSSNLDEGKGVACDGQGNIYWTGIFTISGTQVFNDAGSVVANIRPLMQNFQFSTFVIKLNASGTFQWYSSLMSAGGNLSLDIAVDVSGNSYTTGYYNPSGLQIYDNSGTLVRTLQNAINNAAFLVCFNTHGQVQWATIMDGASGDQGHCVAVDNQGNAYMGGLYYQTPQVYNNSGVSVATLRTATNYAAYIMSIASGGNTTTTASYTLPTSSLTSTNNGFQKLLYHAPNSNASTATVNVTNPSGTTLSTYTIGQGSNVSLVWVDTQWLRLA